MTPNPLLKYPTLLADGGLETCLIFHQQLDLPEFAAFPLLDSDRGREQLAEYLAPYLELAIATGTPFLVDTPTWRANADWGARVGYDPAALDRVNRDAVAFARELHERFAPGTDAVVVEGVVGPRSDGYVVGEKMTVAGARDYHLPQIRALAGAGADLIAAITMTYPEEGAGIALAAHEAGVPVVVSFTTEIDGLLPDGTTLEAAIAAVDRETGAYPHYYMVNCAHPDHFGPVLTGEWADRIGGIRANASRQSHAELDAATELDPGDPAELGAQYRALRDRFPTIRVLGGCCGTDIRHLREIAAAAL